MSLDYEPPKPTGSTEFNRWVQFVHDRLTKKFHFRGSPTVKVTERPDGYIFEASAPTVGIEMTVCVDGVPTTYIVQAVKKG